MHKFTACAHENVPFKVVLSRQRINSSTSSPMKVNCKKNWLYSGLNVLGVSIFSSSLVCSNLFRKLIKFIAFESFHGYINDFKTFSLISYRSSHLKIVQNTLFRLIATRAFQILVTLVKTELQDWRCTVHVRLIYLF